MKITNVIEMEKANVDRNKNIYENSTINIDVIDNVNENVNVYGNKNISINRNKKYG